QSDRQPVARRARRDPARRGAPVRAGDRCTLPRRARARGGRTRGLRAHAACSPGERPPAAPAPDRRLRSPPELVLPRPDPHRPCRLLRVRHVVLPVPDDPSARGAAVAVTRRRRFLGRLNLGVSALVALAIWVAVTVLATRPGFKALIDVTPQAHFSVSAETRQLLDELRAADLELRIDTFYQ